MSTVKVNTVDKRTGGTLTLGGCGTTVTLGAGATQSGFGRTGTVDWCTTAKTAPFTGVSGNGYFVNTTCGAVTVTLPGSPSAGDIISIADYASTWSTNAVTLCRNGSLINAGSVNPSLTTTGQSITLVYVDGTRGWKNTMDSTSNVSGAPDFIVATGGTITCCGDYKIHTFTSDGTFIISTAPTPANNNVDYFVVAGGGGGGYNMGGGGGAGGYRESSGAASGCYSVSPLGACVSALPVSTTSYPITVGGGGTGSTTTNTKGISGSNSIFSTITSAGGGGGGSRPNSPDTTLGIPGGSGGGSSNDSPPSNINPAGNTPPVSPPQGNNGGYGRGNTGVNRSGGGGGATGAGGDGSPGVPTTMGPGGAGATSSITGSPVGRAGGGGGGMFVGSCAQVLGTVSDGGGLGGPSAANGTTNTGGGGGGAGHPGDGGTQNGGSGGSGIVIIRYKYQ
jgi:hypothetical protein